MIDSHTCKAPNTPSRVDREDDTLAICDYNSILSRATMASYIRVVTLILLDSWQYCWIRGAA
jgi:hypothetical protein